MSSIKARRLAATFAVALGLAAALAGPASAGSEGGGTSPQSPGWCC